MNNLEFLTQIWNLEKVQRPALIVEEISEVNTYATNPTAISNSKLSAGDDVYGSLFSERFSKFSSLMVGRDDSVPTINSDIGTHIIPCAFGGKERMFEDGHKYLEGPIIFSASDVDKIKTPKAMTSILGKQIEFIEYLSDRTKGEYPIRIGDVQNPLGIAEMMWETSDFYTSLIEEPEQVHKLLKIITEVVIEYVSKVKDVCKNLVPITWPLVWSPNNRGVYIADDTMSMISPNMYEEYGVPYNNIISKEFGGLMLHSCTMKEEYFESIIKNEGLMSVNFAAQYSSDMKKIFDFFGGKVVILPHYVHTDSPQIGTVTEFIDKVWDCWTPETPAIIYVNARPEGGKQQDVIDKYWSRSAL